MKVSREQVAEHRHAILISAARLFRLRGFEEVTVAEIMKEAGLTHGAFYGYFFSKEALIVEAVAHALPFAPGAAAPKPSPQFADGYLSARHRDNRATSCLFSSLGTEASRGSDALRHAMTESIRRRIDQLGQETEGKTSRAKRRAAIAAWSAMVGALLLSRIVDDDQLSKEILAETRSFLPLA